MKDKLRDYLNRFQKGPMESWPVFFTQLGDKYKTDLPYIPDVEIFCGRLWLALLLQQKICIYSDYDTDAVTATGVMYHGLIRLGFKPENLSFYAPDRFTEGYGMNPEAIKELALTNDLIISVDCGINSVAEAEMVLNLQQSSESNCDLIITDHHHLHSEVPKALAVVNPRLSEVYFTQSNKKPENELKLKQIWENAIQKDIVNKEQFDLILDWMKNVTKSSMEFEQSPRQFLSASVTGVGVAWFCVVWLGYFLEQSNDLVNLQTKFTLTGLNFLLPLVAIGTVADCQSVLEPTNRMLVKAGLDIMQKNKYDLPGLKELFVQTGLQDKMDQGYKLTSQDLGFTLSPILNSSGRVSHAKLSIGLMVEANPDNSAAGKQHITQTASELIATNQNRKQMVKDILEEVEIKAQQQATEKTPLIWLEGEYSKGIVGLLASRLVNMHNIPVVVVAREEEGLTASLRAPEGYHLPEAMTKAGEDLFLKFGGHPGAAGFTTIEKNIQAIKSNLSEQIAEQSKNLSLAADSFVDKNLIPIELAALVSRKEVVWLDEKDVSQGGFELVWKMDPFGQDFPFPVFSFEIVKPFEIKLMGQNQNHARLTMASGLNIVAFNLKQDIIDRLLQLKDSEKVWVLAKVTQNSWNGQTKNELIADKLWLID